MSDDPFERVRIKVKKFLATDLFREDLKRAQTQGFSRKGEHLFYRLSMSYKMALDSYDEVTRRIEESRYNGEWEIDNLKHPEDTQEFMFLYNAIFLAAPDPSRTISIDEARLFSEESTFIIKVWGMMAGFIYLVTEQDPLGSGERVGAIAGIGVLPKFRGRKLGLVLIKHAIDYFRDKNISQLICEVYAENEPSLKMFQGLGMEIVGHMILEEEDTNTDIARSSEE